MVQDIFHDVKRTSSEEMSRFFLGGSPQNPEHPQNSAPSSTKKIQIRHPQKHTKFSLRFTEAPHLWCEDGVEPRGGCVFFSKTPIFVAVTTRR